MSVTLNVYVKDRKTGQGIPNARVVGLTKNQIIDPPVRQTSGDGGANLYFNGPPFDPPVAVSLAVDAPGYAPGSTNDQPILLGSSSVDYTIELDSFKQPFRPAPRVWKANMCGVRVPGLQPVAGGAKDPSLVLSWFYDRYDGPSRAAIRATWQAKGLTHVLLSWPDSRSYGQSPQQFAATCKELIAAGFYPCVFFCSKDCDPPDVETIKARILEVLPFLVGLIPMACIGWELSLWLSPTQVQQLIDWLAPQLVAVKCRVYVHWQEGYYTFPQPDHDNASFLLANVGKLSGVLHQRDLSLSKQEYRDRLVDCLQRSAGQFNCPAVMIDGHGYDVVACEITAQPQFNGEMSEAEGNSWGQWAIDTPAVDGPVGPVSIMGSGNGLEAA